MKIVGEDPCKCRDFFSLLCLRWLRANHDPAWSEGEARLLVRGGVTVEMVNDGYEHLLPIDSAVVYAVCREFYRKMAIEALERSTV